MNKFPDSESLPPPLGMHSAISAAPQLLMSVPLPHAMPIRLTAPLTSLLSPAELSCPISEELLAEIIRNSSAVASSSQLAALANQSVNTTQKEATKGDATSAAAKKVQAAIISAVSSPQQEAVSPPPMTLRRRPPQEVGIIASAVAAASFPQQSSGKSKIKEEKDVKASEPLAAADFCDGSVKSSDACTRTKSPPPKMKTKRELLETETTTTAVDAPVAVAVIKEEAPRLKASKVEQAEIAEKEAIATKKKQPAPKQKSTKSTTTSPLGDTEPESLSRVLFDDAASDITIPQIVKKLVEEEKIDKSDSLMAHIPLLTSLCNLLPFATKPFDALPELTVTKFLTVLVSPVNSTTELTGAAIQCLAAIASIVHLVHPISDTVLNNLLALIFSVLRMLQKAVRDGDAQAVMQQAGATNRGKGTKKKEQPPVTPKQSVIPIRKLFECFHQILRHLTTLAMRSSFFAEVEHLPRVEEIAISAMLLHAHHRAVDPLFSSLCSQYLAPVALPLLQLTVIRSGRAAQTRHIQTAMAAVSGATPTLAARVFTFPHATSAGAPVKIGAFAAMALFCSQALPTPDMVQGASANKQANSSAAAHADLEHCHLLARTWVHAVFSNFFSEEKIKRTCNTVEDKHANTAIAVGFVKDLCEALSCPEVPIADFFLRHIVLGLVRQTLKNDSLTERAAAEHLRGYAVELIGCVVKTVLTISTNDRWARRHSDNPSALLDSSWVTEPQEAAWSALLAVREAEAEPNKSAKKPSKRQGKSKKDEQEPHKGEVEESASSAFIWQLQVQRYHILSAEARNDASGGVSWFSARQYHVAQWAGEHPDRKDRFLPYLSVIAHDPVAAAAPSEKMFTQETYRMLQSQNLTIDSQRSKSVFHPDATDLMLQNITFVLREAESKYIKEGWDTARRNALALIPVVVDQRPALFFTAWKAARESAADDSPRVRESATCLIEALFDRIEAHCARHNEASEDTQQSSEALPLMSSSIEWNAERRVLLGKIFIEALLSQLSDGAPSVARRAGQALCRILLNSVGFLPQHPDLERRVIMNLLQVMNFDESVHLNLIVNVAVSLAKRWFSLPTAGSGLDGGSPSKAVDLGGDSDDDGVMEYIPIAAGSAMGMEKKGGAERKKRNFPQRAINDVGVIAAELISCAVHDIPLPYDFGNTDMHPLVRVITNPTQNRSIAAGGNPEQGAAKKRRRATKGAEEGSGAEDSPCEELGTRRLTTTRPRITAGRAIARELCHGIAANPPRYSLPQAIATLHLLAAGNAKFVTPFGNVLVELVSSLCADVEGESGNKTSEDSAVALLHGCHCLKHLVRASSSLPLPPLFDNLSQLLKKFASPYHTQKILLAAVNCLCATVTNPTQATIVTPKKAPEDPTKAGDVGMCAVFSIVNWLFQRTRQLIPSLATDANSISYVLRTLFLLSEFFRSLRWDRHYQSLLKLVTTPFPNLLSSSKSSTAILPLCHKLVQEVLAQCPEQHRPRAQIVVVRTIGSLCIQAPTEYLLRSEQMILDSLSGSAALQVQSLLLLKDFLLEEEKRIVAATSKPHDTNESPNRLVATDANSGMATWVMQRFGNHIFRLCCASPAPAVRRVAFDTLELGLQQGLMPPLSFTESLVVSVADPSSGFVRNRALMSLKTLVERQEEFAMAGKAISGIVKSFDLLWSAWSAAQPSKNSEVTKYPVFADVECFYPATEMAPCECLHAGVYRLLGRVGGRSNTTTVAGRKQRCSVLSGLVRWMYHPTRLTQWVDVRAANTAAADSHSSTIRCASSDVIGVLVFLARTTAFFPLAADIELASFLDYIRTCCDLCVDASQAVLESGASAATTTKKPAPKAATTKKKSTDEKKNTKKKEEEDGEDSDSSSAGGAVLDSRPEIEFAIAVALILLLQVKQFLCREYGISPAKLHKLLGLVRVTRTEQSPTTKPEKLSVPTRTPNSKATEQFLEATARTGQLAALAWPVFAGVEDEKPIDSKAPARGGAKKGGGVEANPLGALQNMLNDLMDETVKDLLQCGDEVSIRAAKPRGKAARNRRLGSESASSSEVSSSAEASSDSSSSDESE